MLLSPIRIAKSPKDHRTLSGVNTDGYWKWHKAPKNKKRCSLGAGILSPFILLFPSCLCWGNRTGARPTSEVLIPLKGHQWLTRNILFPFLEYAASKTWPPPLQTPTNSRYKTTAKTTIQEDTLWIRNAISALFPYLHWSVVRLNNSESLLVMKL